MTFRYNSSGGGDAIEGKKPKKKRKIRSSSVLYPAYQLLFVIWSWRKGGPVTWAVFIYFLSWSGMSGDGGDDGGGGSGNGINVFLFSFWDICLS
jgi:hypothetical protein